MKQLWAVVRRSLAVLEYGVVRLPKRASERGFLVHSSHKQLAGAAVPEEIRQRRAHERLDDRHLARSRARRHSRCGHLRRPNGASACGGHLAARECHHRVLAVPERAVALFARRRTRRPHRASMCTAEHRSTLPELSVRQRTGWRGRLAGQIDRKRSDTANRAARRMRRGGRGAAARVQRGDLALCHHSASEGHSRCAPPANLARRGR